MFILSRIMELTATFGDLLVGVKRTGPNIPKSLTGISTGAVVPQEFCPRLGSVPMCQ